MREPVELEVLVLRGQLIQPAQHLVPAHRLLPRLQQEGGHHPEGDRGDDAESAQANRGRGQQLGPLGRRAGNHLTAGQHQLKTGDLGRYAAAIPPGPMRAGLDGARHRLLLDVAEVGESQAVGEQGLVQHLQRAARFRGYQASLFVDVTDATEAAGPQQYAVGDRRRSERVPRASHPHGQSQFTAQPDRVGHLSR